MTTQEVIVTDQPNHAAEAAIDPAQEVLATPVVSRTPAPPAQVAATMQTIVDELSLYFLERRSVIHAMALAVLAKEHLFMLGPPGTAKSYLTRSFFGRIEGAKYFEAILSKTRPAEAILGPYDIPELRDHGHLFRKYKGHLPDADFAMLDEVGKMSPTLGHDLLSVTLERRLHQVNGGRSWIDLPLRTFIGGSNELPTEESDDAAALWDRMLVRTTVDYLQESGNFAQMLTSGPAGTGTTVDFFDLANVIDNVVPTIKVPHDVVQTILDLRDKLRSEEIAPSDRRWKQSIKLLQASAFLAGRTEVDADDIQVLRHALWDTPSQIQLVERLTLSVSNPIAEMALGLLEKAEEIATEVRNAKGLSNTELAGLGVQLNGNLRSLESELGNARQKAMTSGSSTTKLDEVGDRIKAVKRQVLSDILKIDMA